MFQIMPPYLHCHENNQYSFSYVDKPRFIRYNALLKYVKGLLLWLNTTPNPVALASVSKTNGMLKSSKAKISALLKASFKPSNGTCDLSF